MQRMTDTASRTQQYDFESAAERVNYDSFERKALKLYGLKAFLLAEKEGFELSQVNESCVI